ncbi:histidine phosphatase family protein [Exiguobacterium mexicanum]|uniref:histidine phosphatase family protein n=1 Tax=Exiguobacterium mexicanum TaxID=340146 RepID=UPI0037C1366E
MPTFYLIRHCSATGQEPEAPLTEAGEQQALALADFFRDIPVDRIISSDYTRAVASITPLAASKQLTIETEPKLRERILSLEPRDDWFELLRHSFTDASFRLPGAESGKMRRTES